VNLRLTLSYDGTAFHGWAAQPHLRTVQGVVQGALAETFGRWERLAVAGRTDTGVHALHQVASVQVSGGPPAEAARPVLNARLPADVVVLAAEAVADDFHARHAARWRTYRYRVLTGPVRSALDARRVLHEPRALDLETLEACAAALPGTHDFTAFTPSETQHTVFTRRVENAGWRRQGDELWFEITADAFLRHQVRTLVGTMLQAARGERPPRPFTELLRGAPRAAAGPTAPPWGLYLTDVGYPDAAPAVPDGA
jgi:tRNA pseudouridine38-40 synthase